MAATAPTERHAPNLHGALSFYDHIIVTGTLPGARYPGRDDQLSVLARRLDV
jgi:hypothetical protein